VDQYLGFYGRYLDELVDTNEKYVAKHMSLDDFFRDVMKVESARERSSIINALAELIEYRRNEMKFWENLTEYLKNFELPTSDLVEFGSLIDILKRIKNGIDLRWSMETLTKQIKRHISNQTKVAKLMQNSEEKFAWNASIDAFTTAGGLDVGGFKRFVMDFRNMCPAKFDEAMDSLSYQTLMNFASKKPFVIELSILLILDSLDPKFHRDLASRLEKIFTDCVKRGRKECCEKILDTAGKFINGEQRRFAFEELVIHANNADYAGPLLRKLDFIKREAFQKYFHQVLDTAVFKAKMDVIQKMVEAHFYGCDARKWHYMRENKDLEYERMLKYIHNNDFKSDVRTLVESVECNKKLDKVVKVMLRHKKGILNWDPAFYRKIQACHPELIPLIPTRWRMCESLMRLYGYDHVWI
jgi:hypothetical protein